MEMFRRVFLVGIMVLLQRGSVTQLVIGAIFAMAYQLLQMQANPYADSSDDFLANASSFALSVFFVCSIIFKIASLTELGALRERMSIEQKADFDVPSVLLSFVMLGAVVGALLLSAAMFVVQLAQERTLMEREARASRARRLRYVDGHTEVIAPVLGSKDHFHLFV